MVSLSILFKVKIWNVVVVVRVIVLLVFIICMGAGHISTSSWILVWWRRRQLWMDVRTSFRKKKMMEKTVHLEAEQILLRLILWACIVLSLNSSYTTENADKTNSLPGSVLAIFEGSLCSWLLVWFCRLPLEIIRHGKWTYQNKWKEFDNFIVVVKKEILSDKKRQ